MNYGGPEMQRYIEQREREAAERVGRKNKKRFRWYYLSPEAKMIAWHQALCSPECGGYYSDNPCHAQSCDPAHPYCPEHQELIDAENNTAAPHGKSPAPAAPDDGPRGTGDQGADETHSEVPSGGPEADR